MRSGVCTPVGDLEASQRPRRDLPPGRGHPLLMILLVDVGSHVACGIGWGVITCESAWAVDGGSQTPPSPDLRFRV